MMANQLLFLGVFLFACGSIDCPVNLVARCGNDDAVLQLKMPSIRMKDAVRKNVKGCLGECKKPFAATQDGVLTMIKGYKKK